MLSMTSKTSSYATAVEDTEKMWSPLDINVPKNSVINYETDPTKEVKTKELYDEMLVQ